MPSPLLSLLIPAFAGDFQGQNPLTLADVFSSGGSLNLHMGKSGQLKTSPGWSQRGSVAAPAEDTYFVFALLQAPDGSELAWFVGSSGSSLMRQIYVDSVPQGWSAVSGVDTDNQNPVCFALFGTKVYLTTWDTVFSVTNGTGATVTSAQLTAPTLADSGTAGALAGSYRGRLIPVKANKERKIASAISAAVRVQNEKINWSWTADADTDVLGYELWRTTGTGLDLYYVTYIDGRTTVAYSGDNLADSVLITRDVLALIAQSGDTPPADTRYCTTHGGRMWWLGSETLGVRRGYYSDPGNAESTDRLRGYIDWTDGPSVSDEIVGGSSADFGLITWMRRNIWVTTGTGTVIGTSRDWRPKRSNASIGTIGIRTVVEIPAGAKYPDENGDIQVLNRATWAYLTPAKDIRVFDGDSDTIVSYAKKDTLQQLNLDAFLHPDDIGVFQGMHLAYAVHHVDQGHIIWGIPYGSAQATVNRGILWDYVRGTWHELTDWALGHAIEAITDGGDSFLWGGAAVASSTIKIYDAWDEEETGRGVASNFTHRFMSKPIYLPVEPGGPPDLSHEKIIEAVALLFGVDDEASDSLLVGFMPHDVDDSGVLSFVYGNNTSSYKTASGRVYQQAQQPATGTVPGRYLHSVGFRLVISSLSNTGPWTMNGIEILYRVKQGQTR